MDAQVSIGEALRRRREERGLTAEQAAFQSKVPLRLVQVLESDDYQLLPDPLYLVRLLHEYAMFLGLNAATLEAEFQQAIQRPPRTSLAPVPALRHAPTIPWRQVLWTVAAILVIAPLVLIALSLASKRVADQGVQTRPVESRPEDAVSASGGVVGSNDRLRDESAPSALSPVVAPSPDTAAAPVVGTRDTIPPPRTGAVASVASVGHVLIARAQEPTWMSVQADRKDRREVLLQAGQTARFEAETGFHITLGNAGGVTLAFNGTPLPPLGRSGEVVRDLVLPPVPRDSPSSQPAPATPTR